MLLNFNHIKLKEELCWLLWSQLRQKHHMCSYSALKLSKQAEKLEPCILVKPLLNFTIVRPARSAFSLAESCKTLGRLLCSVGSVALGSKREKSFKTFSSPSELLQVAAAVCNWDERYFYTVYEETEVKKWQALIKNRERPGKEAVCSWLLAACVLVILLLSLQHSSTWGTGLYGTKVCSLFGASFEIF